GVHNKALIPGDNPGYDRRSFPRIRRLGLSRTGHRTMRQPSHAEIHEYRGEQLALQTQGYPSAWICSGTRFDEAKNLTVVWMGRFRLGITERLRPGAATPEVPAPIIKVSAPRD